MVGYHSLFMYIVKYHECKYNVLAQHCQCISLTQNIHKKDDYNLDQVVNLLELLD